MSNKIKIKLTGLRVFAHHGVLDFEKAYGQWFEIDATVWVENKNPETAADLKASVHYGELADLLVSATKTERFDLLETLANHLLKVVMSFGGADSPVLKAKITVHKPNAPIDHEFTDVRVTVKGKRQ